MLIDTRQIISLSELRGILGRVMEDTASGKTFLVTERGQIKGMIVPPPSANIGAPKEDVFAEVAKIRRKIDKAYRESGSTWKSEEVIRKMRDDRTKYLLSRHNIK